MLTERIGALLPGVELLRSDALGLPSAAKEAVAFALLGWFTAHGLPGTLPSCTGATGGRVLGRITPGHGPLRLPEPFDRASGCRPLQLLTSPSCPPGPEGERPAGRAEP